MFAVKTSKIVDRLIEKGISNQDDRDIIIYGLSFGCELLVNISTAIALGFIWGLVLEAVLFLISFSLLRTYAGGYHCKKSFNCYVLSSGIIVMVLVIIKFTLNVHLFATDIVALLLLLSIFTLVKFAPMETPTKPLDNMEKKYFRKKMITHLIVECVSMCILLLYGLHKFAYTICLGILVTAGLILLQKIESKLKRK